MSMKRCFSVNLDAFSVHPAIGGTFENENEAYDRQKHPVSFHFQSLKPLRMLRDNIEVLIEGKADIHGYIAECTDVATGAVNETITPKNMCVLTGYKLKVAGDHPDVGVWFEQTDGPAKLKVSNLAENTPTKLIGLLPDCPSGTYKVVIMTQYTNSSKLLKDIRVIESGFTLTI